MPTIIARVEKATKAHFRSMAMERGLTESGFLRAVILAVAGEDSGIDQPVEPIAGRAKVYRMMVRLPMFLVDAARARAQSKGMAPSRWLASLAQSNLMRQPVMTDDELITLRSSNRELAAIGRNLNQIVRALNNDFDGRERVEREMLEGLRQEVASIREIICALVRASQQSWEAD